MIKDALYNLDDWKLFTFSTYSLTATVTAVHKIYGWVSLDFYGDWTQNQM